MTEEEFFASLILVLVLIKHVLRCFMPFGHSVNLKHVYACFTVKHLPFGQALK